MNDLTDNEQKFLSCLEAVSDESIWGMAIKVVMKTPTAARIRGLITDLKSQAKDNSEVMLSILGQPCYEQLLML